MKTEEGEEEKKGKDVEKTLEGLSVARERLEYFAKNRKLFLWDGVDDDTAKNLVQQLLYLDSLNHDDITLFINSPGGVISSGLAIYDAMQSVESDVRTV